MTASTLIRGWISKHQSGEKTPAMIAHDLECVATEVDRLNVRIDDLLATTSKYQEEARQARRERDALLQGFKGMAAAFVVMTGKGGTP